MVLSRSWQIGAVCYDREHRQRMIGTVWPGLNSIVYSGANQRKHQSSASLAFVRGIHRWPVNSPHKGAVTRKMFPFDDIIMGKGAVMLSFDTSWWIVFTFECKPPVEDSLQKVPRARLTKSYDVTIQRYRKWQTKTKGAVWNFTQNFKFINSKMCILRLGGVKIMTNYDILELNSFFRILFKLDVYIYRRTWVFSYNSI